MQRRRAVTVRQAVVAPAISVADSAPVRRRSRAMLRPGCETWPVPSFRTADHAGNSWRSHAVFAPTAARRTRPCDDHRRSTIRSRRFRGQVAGAYARPLLHDQLPGACRGITCSTPVQNARAAWCGSGIDGGAHADCACVTLLLASCQRVMPDVVMHGRRGCTCSAANALRRLQPLPGQPHGERERMWLPCPTPPGDAVFDADQGHHRAAFAFDHHTLAGVSHATITSEKLFLASTTFIVSILSPPTAQDGHHEHIATALTAVLPPGRA